jgi:carbamoyltransferase
MDYTLGIACNGTDSAACLFEDKTLICAAEEERFTRIRHDGRFPRRAIQWCLESTNVSLGDICSIAVSWDYPRYEAAMTGTSSIASFYRSLELDGHPIDWAAVEQHTKKFQSEEVLSVLIDEFSETPLPHVRFYRHHDCHAASSYCYSDFDSSLVLVMDDKGEDICTSLYLGEGKRLQSLEHRKIPHSLGLYYAAATQFISLTPFLHEGTFMALATCGEHQPKLWSWLLDNVLRNTSDGIVMNPVMVSKEVFRYPRTPGLFYTNQMVLELSKCGIKRPESIEAVQRPHKDFAFTIQEVLESVVLEFLASKLKMYHVDGICITGGVGLNCTLNGKIMEKFSGNTGIQRLFLPPWSHDAGGAIGAAILAMADQDNTDTELTVPQLGRLRRADWGPDYSDDTIERVLRNSPLSFSKSHDLVKETAQYLTEGRIVAWFQGREEFGPRALGQRSLLSHPRYKGNRQRIQGIKQRLPFRPFAPSILEEYASRYFSGHGASTEFMTTSFKTTDSAREEIADTLNDADCSVRPQTVEKRKGWIYRDLLEECHRLTGIPVLLNTSFNMLGEPIVLTPSDAVSSFLHSDIDILAIGNFIAKNPVG